MNSPEKLFALEEINVSRLMLFGYRYFPHADILLHPRMTILSGNNAVGKTTLLDAVQTVFICHLRHINLNAASGHGERDLAGQLRGRIAWICLQITGHETVGAVGVRMRVKPSGVGVELQPYVLEGVEPESGFFLDEETGRICPDRRELQKNVLATSPLALVRDFESVEAYHSFLFENGLFPMDLSAKGAGKELFGALWQQVSRPRMDRLHKFLERMLCSEKKKKKLSFNHVETLMQKRREIEQKLRRLEWIRDKRRRLEGLLKRLDRERFRALGMDAVLCVSAYEKLRAGLLEQQKREAQGKKRIKSLREELDGLEKELEFLEAQRDKYLGRKSDLNRRLEHYRAYKEAADALPEKQEQKQKAENELKRHEQEVGTGRESLGKVDAEIAELKEYLAAARERVKRLSREKGQWEELCAGLEQCAELFARPVQNRQEWEQLRREFRTEWDRFCSLEHLRRERDAAQKRLDAHLAALEKASSLKRYIAPEKESGFAKARLEEEKKKRQGFIKEEWVKREELNKRLEKLELDLEELKKGRPPLPPGAARLVENGYGVPYAARFEHLDLKAAEKQQAGLGPFVSALEPAKGSRWQDLAQGEDPFLIVEPEESKLADCGIMVESDEGTIAGTSGLGWYSPRGPVLLGVEARAEQMREINREMENLRREAGDTEEREKELNFIIDLIDKLLSAWTAYLDRDAESEFKRLDAEVRELEGRAKLMRQQRAAVDRVSGLAGAFDFEGAPEEFEKEQKGIERAQESLDTKQAEKSELERTLSRLEQDIKDLQKKCEKHAAEEKKLQNRMQTLEEEEPREILEGKIDFSRAEELERELERVQGEIKRKRRVREQKLGEEGGCKNELRDLAESIARQERELAKAEQRRDEALQKFSGFYPREPVPEMRATEKERATAESEWERTSSELDEEIKALAEEQEIRVPRDSDPETVVTDMLTNLLPQDVALEDQENTLRELRAELGQIEGRIRNYVEQIRTGVDQEIHQLDRKISGVNRILSGLRFGRIRRISLRRDTNQAYEGLKKLRGKQMNLFQLDGSVSVQEFIADIQNTIYRYGRTRLAEEEILDYRSYIRIGYEVEDESGENRTGGLSGGEGLGMNLAICLSLLFYFGKEHGAGQGQGVLMMALDEAERLDDESLKTIRGLLEQVHCQLLVALPRVVGVPGSLCHMLSPLSEGVTQVSVYHGQEENSEMRSEGRL
ncbi:MAG: SbcC/MukB-like Walker B domain-containing protein [Desulfonatronovibrionaceae bacterium]